MEERVASFLIEGSVVRTKHSDNNNWVSNTVYKIHENEIEIDIGLEKEYIDNIIMIGDVMKVKYTSEEYEYIIDGWVTNINFTFPQSITIHIHNINKFINYRSNYRYDVYFSSAVKKIDGEKGTFAILINISSAGLGFVSKGEFDINDKVSLEVFTTPDEILRPIGIIVRKVACERGIEYGLRLTELDEKSQAILERLIKELQVKDMELENRTKNSYWQKHSKYNKAE